jgi:hypothetical protein
VAAREVNVDEGAELRPALGASNDEPLVADPKLKRVDGGGFDGVVDAVAGWNWKVGAAFFSVAAPLPNLIGVPGLKV